MLSKFFLLLLLTPQILLADEAFEPVNAADQPVITSLSIEEELRQFYFLSQWETNREAARTTELRVKQSALDLERARELHDAGHLTDTKYAQAFYAHKVLEGESIRIGNEVIKAKMGAQFHKLRVLELGNPGASHATEISSIVVAALDLELVSLDAQTVVAQAAHALASTNYAHGQELSKKGGLSAAELEQRHLTAELTENKLTSLDRQRALARTARANFEKNAGRTRIF